MLFRSLLPRSRAVNADLANLMNSMEEVPLRFFPIRGLRRLAQAAETPETLVDVPNVVTGGFESFEEPKKSCHGSLQKVFKINQLAIDRFSVNSIISFIANKGPLRYYDFLFTGIRRLWVMQYDGMWSPFCRVSRM